MSIGTPRIALTGVSFLLVAAFSVADQPVAQQGVTQEKAVMLWGPEVPNTFFQVSDANAPCGARVNGATLLPGYAQCADPFCVHLPKEVGKVMKVILMAKDQIAGEKQCSYAPNTDCEIGWSRFWSSPEIHSDKICGHFKNRSNDRERWPGFYVIYMPK